jgi:hypothetical protein
MAELPKFPSPVMGHTAGLEKHDSGFTLGEERKELLTGEPMRLGDLAGMVGDGDLKDVLCQIDSDRSRFSHGLLLSVCPTTRLWHKGRSRRRSPSHHSPSNR